MNRVTQESFEVSHPEASRAAVGTQAASGITLLILVVVIVLLLREAGGF